MSRIAKGSYCRAHCCQKQTLVQIAESGGLRFRCQPCSQTGELREGWTPILARSYPNEASLCATAEIDSKHSRAIVQEIGERLRAFLHEEPELPGSLGAQINRLRELEEQSPSIIRRDKLRC